MLGHNASGQPTSAAAELAASKPVWGRVRWGEAGKGGAGHERGGICKVA